VNLGVKDDYDITFKTVEIPIGGKIVTLTVAVTEQQIISMSDVHVRDHFKEQMAKLLATYMLENNLVETTHYLNQIDGTRKVNVRCYLSPNDQIKILRTAYAASYI
jgi:hypothetical protein